MHQLYIDFKKAYDSLSREVLYNTLIVFDIQMNLAIRMCLNERQEYVGHIGHGLKQRDVLSPSLFTSAVGYAIMRVHVNQDGFKLSGTHQLLVYADGVNILC